MVGDRELLELAARAVGFPEFARMVGAEPVDAHIPSGGIWITGADGNDAVWNPLNDDSDALRLAVRLNLDISFDSVDGGVAVIVGGSWDDAPKAVYQVYEENAMPATRRAIVRAAAEIGRGM